MSIAPSSYNTDTDFVLRFGNGLLHGTSYRGGNFFYRRQNFVRPLRLQHLMASWHAPPFPLLAFLFPPTNTTRTPYLHHSLLPGEDSTAFLTTRQLIVATVETQTPTMADGSKSHAVGVAIVFLLFLFIFFYKPSWGAVTWIWSSEIFSLNVRAQGVSSFSHPKPSIYYLMKVLERGFRRCLLRQDLGDFPRCSFISVLIRHLQRHLLKPPEALKMRNSNHKTSRWAWQDKHRILRTPSFNSSSQPS